MTKRGAIGAAAACCCAALIGWYLMPVSKSARAANSDAERAGIPVTPGVVEAKDVPIYVRGLGTVQANNMVVVKTRVDGQITQVFFTEGQEVKAGDPLFQIDPRPFQAALDQATANKAKDSANLTGAQLDLDRYTTLVSKGFQTRQSYDDQKATVGQLKAAVAADQALIDNAKLNLTYATIKAPIDGRTGARLVDQGNFVQTSQGASLVTITQVKPIFVSFTIPQSQFDTIRQNQANGSLTVNAYTNNEQTKLSEGHLTLIDNAIDPATGTIHLKATFDNTDERLWPGEFVSAQLVLSTQKNAITVPSQTVMQGANGAYVFVIKPDSTVEQRPIQVSTTQDDIAVISKGVALGEHVVVSGQYRLTPGSKVNTAPQQQTPTAPAS